MLAAIETKEGEIVRQMTVRQKINMDVDEILVASRWIFRRSCQRRFEREFVQAELLHGVLFVSFRSVTPTAEEAVNMKLRFRFDHDVMWIGNLHVSLAFRWRGRGRELVETAESIARSLGIPKIHLFPLWSARPFWHKVGYSPLIGTVRVMEKTVRFHDAAKLNTDERLKRLVSV